MHFELLNKLAKQVEDLESKFKIMLEDQNRILNLLLAEPSVREHILAQTNGERPLPGESH